MPVSSVQVTEGSGKHLHTWQRSVNSVNREEQYVQAGESGLPTYNAVAIAVSTATADSHLLQLMAPASAYVRIHRISIEQGGNATSATPMYVYVTRLTSAGSGGTAITPRAFDTSDTAGAAAQALPSSKGTEGQTVMATTLLMRQTVATSGAQMDDAWVWQQTPGKKPLIIPAGTSNGIAIKNTTGVAGGTAIVSIEFTETAWL